MKLIKDYLDFSTEMSLEKVRVCFDLLHAHDASGWLDYPFLETTSRELEAVFCAADFVKRHAEVFLVVGIGGSYLGSRALIDALTPTILTGTSGSGVQVVYVGQNLSTEYMMRILSLIHTREVCVNIVSKSGTTLETDIASRFVLEAMEKKYGSRAAERIFVTTDARYGPLKAFADERGICCFIIPENIGGRFSVFTPVGTFPLAVAGRDSRKFLQGARQGARKYRDDIPGNLASEYAAIRNHLDERGKEIELFVTYEPRYAALAAWWVQLFGESCGKDGVGLFPASANYPSDLHSIGQLVQEGRRNLFETVLRSESEEELSVPRSGGSDDAVGGKNLSEVCRAAYLGSMAAHTKGGVPCIGIELETGDETELGELMYFFMVAVSLSALSQGLNPFDQPGVEAYKADMRKLLSEGGEALSRRNNGL